MTVVFWCLAFLATLPLLEYWAHRWMQHRPARYPSETYRSHVIDHHARRQNRLELVDISFRRTVVQGAAIWLPIGLVDWRGGLVFAVGLFLYGILWTKLHRAHHDLEVNWTCWLPFYSVLRRHHLAHHALPTKNFAPVFLFTDRLFGTRVLEGRDDE